MTRNAKLILTAAVLLLLSAVQFGRWSCRHSGTGSQEPMMFHCLSCDATFEYTPEEMADIWRRGAVTKDDQGTLFECKSCGKLQARRLRKGQTR